MSTASTCNLQVRASPPRSIAACCVAAAIAAGLSACASRPPEDAGNAIAQAAVATWKQRHGAQSPSQMLPGPVAASDLPPIQLTRPVAAETMARLRAEAETWYRSRNVAQAKEAFLLLVELDPADGTAWFRLGNLHQQSNEIAAAARAYRKAADIRGGMAEQPLIRRKSLVNLALLGLARTRQALLELEAEPLDADTSIARAQVTAEYRQLQGQADPLTQSRQIETVEAGALMALPARDRRTRSGGTVEAAGESSVGLGPGTGPADNVRQPARKPARRASPGPGAAAVLDEAPATSGQVRIEYLTGGPKK